MGDKITFEGFHDTKRLLNTDKHFKLKNGETVHGEFPLLCKNSFAHDETIDQYKTTVMEIKSNLNEIKRLAPDDFGNMLPKYGE